MTARIQVYISVFHTYLAEKSGHMTVLDFLVRSKGCKINNTRIFSPVQRQ